jgi:hypothetical protein
LGVHVLEFNVVLDGLMPVVWSRDMLSSNVNLCAYVFLGCESVLHLEFSSTGTFFPPSALVGQSSNVFL